MHICAAETVNSLLWITDHKEAVIAGPVNEDLPENLPLHGVGILKFVDQGIFPAPPEGVKEHGGSGSLQGVKHPEQHIIIIDQPQRALPGCQAYLYARQKLVGKETALRGCPQHNLVQPGGQFPKDSGCTFHLCCPVKVVDLHMPCFVNGALFICPLREE